MKKADIVVGEDYAVGTESYLRRATVLEVGNIERRVYSGARWDWSGHKTNSVAARVRYVGPGAPVLPEKVVPLSQVIRPWVAEEQRQKDRAAIEAAHAAKRAELEKRMVDLQRALARHGINARARIPHSDTVEVVLSRDAVVELIDLLIVIQARLESR